MKIIEHSCKLVLELLTPLHIGSGEADGHSDAGVVCDFNGLPGIPGTSIQGMLRAAVGEALSAKALNSGKSEEQRAAAAKPRVERMFGCAGKRKDDTGRGGRLTVSWGVIHNSKDQPASGRILSGNRDSDPVLRDGARPMLRDHVRLTGRGVAADRAKFDELVVSAGHRFTVELRFVTATKSGEYPDPSHAEDWQTLSAVLRGPGLRLGGKTRRGLGAFKIVRWDETPMINDDGASQAADASRGASELPSAVKCFDIELCVDNLWMFGGGCSDVADSAPVSGMRIEWDGTKQGAVRPVWVVPGSSVKGALWHRACFHANRLAGNFIDKRNEEAALKAEGWMTDLFGVVQGDTGTPGRVFIDDIFIPRREEHLAEVQNHVAINPFTGGAKDGALYNDQPLLADAGPISLRVTCGPIASAQAQEALEAALADLCAGRLSLGAHAGRGYGVFKGKIDQANLH